jgi:hypothetical protein
MTGDLDPLDRVAQQGSDLVSSEQIVVVAGGDGLLNDLVGTPVEV